MDLIDESQKKLYEKCKYKVKIWEHKFMKENGRRPSKLDIKEAESEVRNAYKTYFNLKTAALEHSFMGVDGFNSDEEQIPTTPKIDCSNTVAVEIGDESNSQTSEMAWGKHLNKLRPEKKIEKGSSTDSPNLKFEISKKLSYGSKLIKRNPRKSLSQVKSESSISSVKTLESSIERSSLSQPINSANRNENLSSVCNSVLQTSQSFNIFKNTKMVSAGGFVPSQSINLFPKLLNKFDENGMKSKKIDIDWLDRAENSMKLVGQPENLVTKTDFMSDEDIIDNSDDEAIRDSFHVAKKIKCSFQSDSKVFEKEYDGNLTKDSKDIVLDNNIKQSPIEANLGSHSDSFVPQDINFMKPFNTDHNLAEVHDKKEAKYDLKASDDELLAKLRKRSQNQNFVRINLKKKVYARGKKTQTFSKYKKKMWKNKKKFLADDEGESSGKNGKFKADKLLPLDPASCSDDDELLTLNQASNKNDSKPMASLNECESDEDNMTLAQLKNVSKRNAGTPSKETSKCSVLQTDESVKPILTSNEFKDSVEIKRSPKEREKKGSSRATAKLNKNMKKMNINTKAEKKNDTLAFSNINEHLFDPDEDLDLLLETIRIEHRIKSTGVTPLYTPNVDGNLIDTPNEVFSALRLFGHSEFRGGQEQAVMRILSGKSTLVTLSTGSGKSLCYQLPAYLFRQKYECITLVVSPLISLMEDQLKCIPGVLSAACLHSNQPKSLRDKIIKSVSEGEINILMVSPESIISSENSSGFGSVLARLPPIAFACLDEAHCLSQWSHNFRPSYLVVCRVLQETFGVKTILGLTATATKKTTNSLIEQLKIPDGQEGVIKDTPVPPNLSLSVSKDTNRDQALLELLHTEPFTEFKSIIIYCLRREECEKVAAFLRTTLRSHAVNNTSKKRKRMSLQAEPYHAGISGARRKSVQKAFMSGELRIVVATIAFGMGINMPDLRSVIHYRMPGKFESYVQEIGRAGRDGLPAHCHVFLDRQNGDVFELRRHIYSNGVDRHIIRKLLRKVFVSCNCEGQCSKHEVMFSIESTVQVLDISQEIISTLLCYLELHEKKYIKILRPSYAQCKIISYGGRSLINKMALDCEPLKIALKNHGTDGDNNSNIIEFPILSISRILNWDSGICKRILKNLEWNNVNGQPKRSGLTVEFSDLSFHLLSPGNLPDESLDEVLNSLYNKVLDQENTAYSQLIHINDKLSQVASPTFEKALENNKEKSETLKRNIREYFESDESLNWVEIPEISESEKCIIASDVRALVSRYSDENFTGRSIARIFHGIGSPNFPPHIWGRTKFWRSHLHVHFNTICKLATNEIIKLQ